MFFQNCAPSDMNGDSTESLLADSPDVKKYKAAPFPFDVNINQVAFMTCPVASKSMTLGEDVESPFFTLRVGAFDNRSLAARYPTYFPVSSDPDRSARLMAGVGLKKDFVDYIRTQFSARLANADADGQRRIMRDAVMNSSYKFQVSSGLVLTTRNSSNGFAWNQKHARPILAPLTTRNVANQLTDTRDLGTNGTEKIQHAIGVEITERSFVSSINVPENEVQRDQFRSNIMNYEFVVGFTKPEYANDVFMLESPTGENNDTLYGRTYRFTTTNQWNGRVDRVREAGVLNARSGIQSINSEFLANVQEWETLTKAAPKNLSLYQNQKWDCFSLMIVREVDRRDPATGKILDPGDYEDAPAQRVASLWVNNGTADERKLKFYDYQANSTSPIIPAAKVACPIQRIGSSANFGTLNYQGDNGLSRLRLEVARRFLPAEYWDINTHPEYMCAVPKPSVQGFGQCYQSGDFDGSKFIFYSQTGVELGKSVSCGRNSYTGEVQKECPAFVSVCYRSN